MTSFSSFTMKNGDPTPVVFTFEPWQRSANRDAWYRSTTNQPQLNLAATCSIATSLSKPDAPRHKTVLHVRLPGATVVNGVNVPDTTALLHATVTVSLPDSRTEADVKNLLAMVADALTGASSPMRLTLLKRDEIL